MTNSINNVNMHDLIDLVITTLDARDPYTYAHSLRVAEVAEMIAVEMNLDNEAIENVHLGAHLHDIGKIGIPDNVLNKAGKLTNDDWAYMEAHPRIGYNILRKLPLFHEVSHIVLYHHERYDGQGYPAGLEGDEIPLESRIIAVADSFDAITSNRPYRAGKSYDFAFEEIETHSIDQFCPSTVHSFLAIRAKIPPALDKIAKVALLPSAFVGHDELRHSRKQV